MLATAVREHPTEPLARSIAFWFGAVDLDPILRRFTRGLMRAAALEAWLRELAVSGHELQYPPAIPVPSPGQLSSDPPADGGAKASPVGDAKPAPWWQDPDHVPTMEEADAEVRSRPHGAVIAEICDDLRVLDSILHRAAWHELKDAIDSYGGDLARLQRSNWRRRFKPHRFPESCAEEPPPRWQSPPFRGWTPACARPP